TIAAARSSVIPRRTLLATVSALALLVHAAPAEAVCVGRCAGGGVSGAVATAAASAIANAQQAAQVAQQGASALSRATLAVQAMQAAQSAAHNLALSTPRAVPNGLVAGGLQPNMAAGWSGANAPTQAASGGQTVVNIQQTGPTAILNWQTFN